MILLEFAVNLFTKTWFRIRSLTSARQACRKIAVLSLIRSQRQLAGEGLYNRLLLSKTVLRQVWDKDRKRAQVRLVLMQVLNGMITWSWSCWSPPGCEVYILAWCQFGGCNDHHQGAKWLTSGMMPVGGMQFVINFQPQGIFEHTCYSLHCISLPVHKFSPKFRLSFHLLFPSVELNDVRNRLTSLTQNFMTRRFEIDNITARYAKYYEQRCMLIKLK